MIYIILIILCVFILLNYLFTTYDAFYTPSALNDKLTQNLSHNTLTNFMLPTNQPLYRDDCSFMCDERACKQMEANNLEYDRCVQCSALNKCYHKRIVTGTCDDCKPDETPIKCNDVNNYGCPNPNALDLSNGIKPYFILVDDIIVNSPYNKRCVFCKDFKNYY